jgi:hypothetical protein
MKTLPLEKMDFAKKHKDLYTATLKVKEVMVEKATYLSVKGIGEPGGKIFQDAIGKLYALAYTTKFQLKFAGTMDFAVSRLECLWPEDPTNLPPEKWPWQLLIRIPDAVTASDLARARKEILGKKHLDTSDVERWVWKEGRCLQVLHVGPYNEVGSVYKRLAKHAGSLGLRPTGPGHEIYISDPRRVAPAKLKTIVRLPVTNAEE